MSDQLGVISTALERRPAAHIHKLDADSITVNRYESLLGAPLPQQVMMMIVGHVGQLVEFASARGLVLLVRGR